MQILDFSSKPLLKSLRSTEKIKKAKNYLDSFFKDSKSSLSLLNTSSVDSRKNILLKEIKDQLDNF